MKDKVGAQACKIALAKSRGLEQDIHIQQHRDNMTILTAIFASVFVLPHAAQAQGADMSFQQRCEREMKPTLQVSLREFGYRIDNTVSSRVLNNRSAHNYAGELMLGMTALQSRAEVTIDAPALQDAGSGRECIAPRISVELSFAPMEVYVAREFSPASCSYRAILEHEMRHVKVYQTHLPRLDALVQAELGRRFGGHPLYAPSGKGIDLLDAYVDTSLRPLIKAELARIEALQAALDTQEETFRISSACRGELALNLGTRY